ncbi:MAG: MFS transporter [Acidimicrobiales bacterium]
MSRGRLWARLFPEWSDRNIVVVLGARTAMSAARALAGVVAPVYLALDGFNAERLGALFAVVAVASAAMATAIGLLSDRLGRKPFLVVVPLLAALAGIAFAYDRTTAVLFCAAALGSFGRGSGAGAGAVGPYQPAESAFVVESLPARYRNVVFGRLSFVSSIGALGGGLLALLAPSHRIAGAAATAAFGDVFLATAGLAALAGFLALFIVEARPPRVVSAPSTPGLAGRSRLRSVLSALHLPRRSRPLLYRLWVTNSLNGFAIGMFGPFVTYWLFRRYGASAGEIGVLFAVVNLVTAAATLSAAGLARRWGLVNTVGIVRSAQAALLVPLVLMPTFESAGAVYLLRMVVQRIGLPLRQSYVLAMADAEERAAVTALSNLPSQLTMAVSPLLAGYLFDEVSIALPFDIAAVFQGLNAVLFWFFFRDAPPEEEQAQAEAANAPS